MVNNLPDNNPIVGQGLRGSRGMYTKAGNVGPVRGQAYRIRGTLTSDTQRCLLCLYFSLLPRSP